MFTVTACVPATAELVAAVRSRTLVSELEPVFCASTPVASVRLLTSFDRFESRVPRLEMAVSWAVSEVSCVFQGVYTF